MKVQIYEGPEDEEKTVRLALKKHGDGVALVAVDERGEVVDRGYILTVTERGTVRVHGSLNRGIGLQIKDGRIETNLD